MGKRWLTYGASIALVLLFGLAFRYLATEGRYLDLLAPLPAPGTPVPLAPGGRLTMLGSEHDTPFAATVVDLIALAEIPDDYYERGYRYRAEGTYLVVRVRVTNRGRTADHLFSRTPSRSPFLLRDAGGQLQPGVAGGAITGAAARLYGAKNLGVQTEPWRVNEYTFVFDLSTTTDLTIVPRTN